MFSSEIKEISLVFQWFRKISLSFPQSQAPVELIHYFYGYFDPSAVDVFLRGLCGR